MFGQGEGRLMDIDLDAGLQLIDAIGHHRIALIHAALDRGKIALSSADGNATLHHGIIGLDDINVVALRTLLHCGGGNQYGILNGVYQQPRVHELARKQRVIFVLELRLKFYRSGGLIDLVIEGQKLAGCELLGIVAIPSLNRQVRPAAHLLNDLGNIVFRNRKDHRDRLQLRDHGDTGGIGGLHDVAQIDQAQANTSGNRRGDVAIDDVEFRARNRAFVGFDRTPRLFEHRLLIVEILLRDDSLRNQDPVAFIGDLRVIEGPLVFHQLTLRLYQRDLVGTRIDFHQRVADFHDLTLGVIDLVDRADYASLDRSSVERTNAP